MLFIKKKIFIVVSSMNSKGATKIININENNEVYEIQNSYNLKIFNLSY